MGQQQATEIVIAIPETALRRGVELLARSWGFRVLGRTGSRRGAVQLLRWYHPPVALVDPALAGDDLAAFVEEISAAAPNTRLVLYSAAALDLTGHVHVHVRKGSTVGELHRVLAQAACDLPID